MARKEHLLMLDNVLPDPAAQQVVALRRFLRLTFGAKCSISDRIDVLVRGILISSTKAEAHFEPGQFIDLPVSVFPHVQLPASLRICIGDEEIAPPLLIKTPEDVMSLVGQGTIEAENLSLAAGLLRGTFLLRDNAVSTPHAYVRLNGVVVRPVVVEPSVAKDGGGAFCRFAVPVRPSDLVESGLAIDVYVSGIDMPLANFTYTRTDASVESTRLLKLEEELRQAQRNAVVQVELMNANLQRLLTTQQERVDAFIEYATSILLDNLANAFEQKSDPVSFLAALNDARADTAGPVIKENRPQAIRNADVKADSSHFAIGWYELERDDRGPFRWMGQTALVTNPYPNAPLDRVEVVITHVYGTSEPLLRASVDDVEFSVTATKLEDHYLVTCLPSPGAGQILAQSVRLESFYTGSPSVDEGTNDTRTLGVAASKVEFYYNKDEAREDA